MKILIPLFLVVTITFSAKAQLTSCAQTLRLARSTYEQGRLHEIPSLLQKCLTDNSFSTEEKIQAYKLLTLSYIYLEEPEKADETMLSILRTDPEYAPNVSVDPAEFMALYRTFRTNPLFSVGVKVGVTQSWFNTAHANGINDLSGAGNETRTENSTGLAIHGGVMIDLPISNKFSLGAELLVANYKMSTENESLFYGMGNNGALGSLGKTETEFTFNTFQLPVNVTYIILQKKFIPYVSAGVTPMYLARAEVSPTRFITDYAPVLKRDYELKESVNNWLISAQLSAGARYKVKRGMIYGEVRFNYGLNNVTNSDGILRDIPELPFAHGLVMDINKINSLYFSVGYMRHQYNPKKKTK